MLLMVLVLISSLVGDEKVVGDVEFSYHVSRHQDGLDFGHREARGGQGTQGTYRWVTHSLFERN